MKFLTRLIWKTIPKNERQYLLSHFTADSIAPIDKILNGTSEFPKVFHKKKLIFIHVPKAAGTSITKTLYGKSPHHIPLKYIEAMNRVYFEEYYKVAFVRNPWDRALSAYNFIRNGGGWGA